MNKTELVNIIAEDANVSKTDALNVFNAIFDRFTRELSDGNQVAVPGFGTFSIRARAARTGRNPRTGEPLEIKASLAVGFKAGKALKDAVQEDAVA